MQKNTSLKPYLLYFFVLYIFLNIVLGIFLFTFKIQMPIVLIPVLVLLAGMLTGQKFVFEIGRNFTKPEKWKMVFSSFSLTILLNFVSVGLMLVSVNAQIFLETIFNAPTSFLVGIIVVLLGMKLIGLIISYGWLTSIAFKSYQNREMEEK